MIRVKELFKNKFLRLAFIAFVSVVVFYRLGFSLKAHIIHQQKKVKEKATIKELNLWMPTTFSAIYACIKDPSLMMSGISVTYTDYYKKVAEAMPGLPDALAMYGFILYHDGEIDEAIQYYQKAVEHGSFVFWYPYNLGVIYFNRQEYAMAEVMFELALKADPVHTIKFIYASKIYQQIITSTKDFDYSLDNSIREGYQNAYRMLVLAQMEQKKYPQAVLSAQRAMQSGFEDNGFFLYYQGRASLEAGEFQKASQFLAERIRRKPKNAEAFRYLGITLN